MVERYYPSAADIIRGLGGNPNTGRCPCPAHEDENPSLDVKEGHTGVVVICRAGCSQDEVIDALKAHGLWPRGNTMPKRITRARRVNKEDEDDEFERLRIKHHRILRSALMAKAGKPTAYLAGRSISIVPNAAMILPASETDRLIGKPFPAMTFPIIQDDKMVGAHLTFLSNDATSKRATDPYRMFGRPKGGYVPLRPIDPDRPLIVGEGIETVLSAMEIAGLPGVAACSAANLPSVRLPACREVIIAVDNDDPGRKAATQLAERLEVEGHTVTCALPPKKGMDWNDVLQDHSHDEALEIWTQALDEETEREETTLSHSVEDFMELAFPKREMLMAPWLPQPGIAMIFARAGHAKTYTALGIAYAVARGDEFLGWQCERPGCVLYIDGEMPGGYLQQRLALYGKAPKGTLHIVCRDTFNLHKKAMPDLGRPVRQASASRVGSGAQDKSCANAEAGKAIGRPTAATRNFSPRN